jgi:hypothetical protein
VLSASLSAADVQAVAMGEAFVGIVHPCKVYNFLAVERPFVFIGPARGHVPDLIRDAGLADHASAFRHGESSALAADLRCRAASPPLAWPTSDRFARWTEAAVVEEILRLVENPNFKRAGDF